MKGGKGDKSAKSGESSQKGQQGQKGQQSEAPSRPLLPVQQLESADVDLSWVGQVAPQQQQQQQQDASSSAADQSQATPQRPTTATAHATSAQDDGESFLSLNMTPSSSSSGHGHGAGAAQPASASTTSGSGSSSGSSSKPGQLSSLKSASPALSGSAGHSGSGDGTAAGGSSSSSSSSSSKHVALSSKLGDGAALPPWVRRTAYSKNKLYSLEQEMYDFVEFIKPTPLEHQMREEIVQRIREVITGAWKHARVEVFGSFATGLYLPMSDIDIVVFGNWDQIPLFTLGKLLEESRIAKNVKVIDKTSVPIIKLADALSGVFVDISFNLESGLRTVEFIRACVDEYRMLYHLTFVIKQFLAQRQLNEPYSGGLGSYSVVLLVVSFLQRHPRQDRDPNFGVLLVEFFELYGKDFNYRKVGIAVTEGGRYFPKSDASANSNEVRPFIQDPMEPGNDVGYKTYNMIAVRDAFRHAYDTLTRVTTDQHSSLQTLLGQIIRVEDDVMAFREWVAKCDWQSGRSITGDGVLPMNTTSTAPPPMSAAARASAGAGDSEADSTTPMQQ
ncbi:hypothetical protein CAOG_008933 [Capsaspora owczarzaki ATCC 30864]|uniref:polynucleotide adenylyltransferase n=2 Tax=Capsaspora owczarzaki (strain ATCC 30864) TaxID=595528 RepID=A0A0D2WUI9_CAPO3|nr:hypothetical protein CAOG_008933 [Capsaspora owczarzaki ATCC 30864]